MVALTTAERETLRARLASWFGDPRQAFLVSDIAPAVEAIINARVVAERERIAVEFEGMAAAWGGDQMWLTTGTKVSKLAAGIVRESSS